MRTIALIGLFVLLVSASAALSAENAKVSLDANDMPIEQAVADLSKQAGVQIVCDRDVKANVSGRFVSMELDEIMNTITKSNNLKWQKVYLPPQGEQKPTLEQIKARAEAVSALSGGSIVIYDPVTKKQKVFVEQDPASPSVEPDKLKMKPIYLISKPKTEIKEAKAGDQDAVNRYQSLEQERRKLMSEMTPEQRVGVMQADMMYLVQAPQDVREQMVLDQSNARHNMPREMRDQYWNAMRDTYRTLRDKGLITEDWGRRGGDRNSRGDRGGNN